ncbi:MAG: hypothetical protein H0W63_03945 [Gemmatimonadaceae bacterium]|nr:hypothetical protein [Gemmatimonadaceae bacterium]
MSQEPNKPLQHKDPICDVCAFALGTDGEIARNRCDTCYTRLNKGIGPVPTVVRAAKDTPEVPRWSQESIADMAGE